MRKKISGFMEAISIQPRLPKLWEYTQRGGANRVRLKVILRFVPRLPDDPGSPLPLWPLPNLVTTILLAMGF